MENREIEHWVVITGSPVFTCKTRKQAREYAKQHKARTYEYNYVGKLPKSKRMIVLEL